MKGPEAYTIPELAALQVGDSLDTGRLGVTLGVVLRRLKETDGVDTAGRFLQVLRILEDVPAEDRVRVLESTAAFFGIPAGVLLDTEPPEPPL